MLDERDRGEAHRRPGNNFLLGSPRAETPRSMVAEEIEGQVRSLQHMVEEEAYCVREAIEDGEKADEKVTELAAAVERFLRV